MSLKQLERIAGSYTSHADDTTPEGHFVFVAEVMGVWRTYLLRGEFGDPNAVIVGQIVNNIVYGGHGLVGGMFLGIADDSESAFARMITYCTWIEE